ncbi:MAG TPA: hypothetical protein VMD07_03290 [Candidatus Acidoferrales bacterium]|nr:hypothetical protein [Candidatus Acidoferrales bacterium]
MMHRKEFIWSVSSALIVATHVPVFAQMGEQKLSPHADAAERAFIARASRFVHKHYATTAAAARAGFVRFTNEDKSGAISWANQRWMSVDADHPSQVWYDASGRLIGVDYSVLQSDTTQPPNLWGINPARWSVFHAHIHYGLRLAGGMKYGAVSTKRFSEAGGSIASPTKQTLVDMGIAKNPSEVAFVFLFPSIWDVNFWVIPNPNGQFAELNPKIKPAKPQPHPHAM